MYDPNPTVLIGVSQVLAVVPAIDNLRILVQQEQDLSTDTYLILSRHNSLQRRPILVLLSKRGRLAAAVFFAERCVMGLGIGLLRAGDQVGDGTVIAPQEERKIALLEAARTMLRQWRCHTVAATLSGVSDSSDQGSSEGVTLFERSARVVRRYLPLSLTFETTLRERFTLRKRKNLLYYHRKLSRSHGVTFVPQLSIAEAELAIQELSRNSWPSRTPPEIADHCRFLRRHTQCFCMGLRSKTGEWLSLITGWRMDGVTHMPWQMNHSEYKDESLMQVMRTHLLRHECGLGQKALSWVGGTVSFQAACEPEVCLDVLMARPGFRHFMLRNALVPLLFRRNPEAFTGGSLMLLLNPRFRRVQDDRLSENC